MSNTQGSETRQRHHDVRIRLRDEDEVRQFDSLVRQRGFHGRTARGDFLRSLLPGVTIRPIPMPSPPRQMSPLRLQLAALDRLASEVQRLPSLLDRMERDVLPADDLNRLRNTLPARIEEIVKLAELVFSRLSAALTEEDA